MQHFAFLIKSVLLAAGVTQAAAGYAQLRPEVDGDEVIRRGDMVERIDGIRRETPVSDALAPPEDDSYKWFITVVTMKGCPACASLARDFAESRDLQAFVNTADYKKSWAHYNVYDSGDPTQNFRFKSINLRAYPTVLIQPPVNGRYGDPKTVVFQKTGYDGDAKKLARQMSEAIKRYAAKMTPVKADAIKADTLRTQQPRSRSGNRGTQETRSVSEAEPPAPAGTPLFTATDAPVRAWGQIPLDTIGVDPPFPLPDDRPTPAVHPLVIPGPIDPDAKPDKKPDDKKPDAESELPKTPTAYIISDEAPDQVAGDKRIARVLEGPRKRIRGLVEKVLSLADAQKILPHVTLDKTKLPAVVVTEDGKVTDQVTADTMPAPALPWQELLSGLLAYFATGAFPYAAIAAAGWYVFLRLRKRRADAGKPKIISDGLLGKLHNLADLLLSRFTPPPPQPDPATPDDPLAKLLALAEQLLNKATAKPAELAPDKKPEA